VKNTTITDIAKKLGISTSTVSRSLNNHPDISDSTKRQVLKIAKELNFSFNPIAKSLKSNRTNTIGVIVPEIKHDFFSSAISGIEEIAYQSDYTIILCQSNESVEREVVNTNLLVNHRVAGLIVSISQETQNGKHFQNVIERNIPLVFFDRACDDVIANKVIIDDFQSAFNAVLHLINKGYKKIAHFTGPKELTICKKRVEGYYSALSQRGIKIEERLIISGGLHEHDGYNSMDLLLRKNLLPDAIFCVNDPVAIGAFQRIREAGLKIPSDIALVGFSNNKITSLIEPAITTINQPSFEMGKQAAQILIDLIERKKTTVQPITIVLDTELIIRNST